MQEIHTQNQRPAITSSIGATWPPTESSNNRLRGFYPMAVNTESEICELQEQFSEYQQLAAEKKLDRLTIRHLGGRATIKSLLDHNIPLEGVFPLANVQDDYLMFYTGWNDVKRTVDSHTLHNHNLLLDSMHSITHYSGNLEDELMKKGYTIHTLDSAYSEQDRLDLIPQFFKLYGKFGFNEDDVEELIFNPDNTIAYLRNSDQEIVSTVLAECAKIAVEGCDPINIYEITEATTQSDLEGNGLYRAISGHLVNIVQSYNTPDTPVHLIYGESNLSSPGVIYAAKRNGRRFVAHDKEIYGVDNSQFGILPQNYKVNDGRELRAYNDFALSYVDLSTTIPYTKHGS